jgi:hypothetical protein
MEEAQARVVKGACKGHRREDGQQEPNKLVTLLTCRINLRSALCCSVTGAASCVQCTVSLLRAHSSSNLCGVLCSGTVVHEHGSTGMVCQTSNSSTAWTQHATSSGSTPGGNAPAAVGHWWGCRRKMSTQHMQGQGGQEMQQMATRGCRAKLWAMLSDLHASGHCWVKGSCRYGA